MCLKLSYIYIYKYVYIIKSSGLAGLRWFNSQKGLYILVFHGNKQNLKNNTIKHRLTDLNLRQIW